MGWQQILSCRVYQCHWCVLMTRGGALEQMLSDNQNNMNVSIQGLLVDYWTALPDEQHGWFEETELAQIDL